MTDSDISPSPPPIKRYYYTDPLAAAWMAKHFGMEFDVNDWDGVIYVKWKEIQDFLRGNFQHFQKGAARFYIRHDSLPLLEPHVSDIVVVHPQLGHDVPPDDPYRHKLKNIGWVVETPWIGLDKKPKPGIARVAETPDSWLGLIRAHKYLEIIQRDGKPFFWPECRNA